MPRLYVSSHSLREDISSSISPTKSDETRIKSDSSMYSAKFPSKETGATSICSSICPTIAEPSSNSMTCGFSGSIMTSMSEVSIPSSTTSPPAPISFSTAIIHSYREADFGATRCGSHSCAVEGQEAHCQKPASLPLYNI